MNDRGQRERLDISEAAAQLGVGVSTVEKYIYKLGDSVKLRVVGRFGTGTRAPLAFSKETLGVFVKTHCFKAGNPKLVKVWGADMNCQGPRCANMNEVCVAYRGTLQPINAMQEDCRLQVAGQLLPCTDEGGADVTGQGRKVKDSA